MNSKKNRHVKTKRNLLEFAKAVKVSKSTKRNLLWFFNQIVEADPLAGTEFELSFKVKDEILHKGEIRLLNIDAEIYSYKDQAVFLKRLLLYKRIMWHRTTCPKKKIIFSALTDLSKTPLDLYGGADIFEENFMFAFWLILGGIKKNGQINFIKNAKSVLVDIFTALGIRPDFAVEPEDILNVGFDLEKEAAFYKIYYILNKKTEKFINKKEKGVVSKLAKLLNGLIKHWFFVSERYMISGVKGRAGRRKVYLEFLEPVLTSNAETYVLMAKIFEIVGCPFKLDLLKKYMGVLEGRIVIIAFEEDGTVTFYIRV
jgi:hypothetical protein